MLRALITRSFISRGGVRPPVAIQVTARGVFATRCPSGGAAPAQAFQPLLPGALVPGLNEPNIRSFDAVTTALKTALEEVSSDCPSVTLLLPDLTTRVFLLDFDSFPENVVQAEAVLRLRLRKIAPFPLEKAEISFQTLLREETRHRLLVVIIPSLVLHDYEAAVCAAGFQPGAVLPSTLAMLERVSTLDSFLFASLDDSSLTTVIAHHNDVVLFRTHELSSDPEPRSFEVQHDLSVAAAFYEDKLKKSRSVFISSEQARAPSYLSLELPSSCLWLN